MPQTIGAIANIQLLEQGIGFQGELLYQLPEDMQLFKELTMNHVVIMGRKTWESIPEKFRPLPGRINIVVTSNPALVAVSETVFIAETPEAALEIAKTTFPHKEIWIIGGAGIYEALLHKCNQLCLTEVPGKKPADTFFPPFRAHFTLMDDKSYVSKKDNTPFYVRIYNKI